MSRSGRIPASSITGVVLAGGEASRMGGADKGLVRVAGKAMVDHVLEALRPQVGALMINANRNLDEYRRRGVSVIADEIAGYGGPLAGMASAMRAARTEFLLTAPCDSPFIPADLANRLAANLVDSEADLSAAHDGRRLQPVFCLLRTRLLASLLAFLGRGDRKTDLWLEEQHLAQCDFSDVSDAFLNLNTPEDVAGLEQRLREPAHAG